MLRVCVLLIIFYNFVSAQYFNLDSLNQLLSKEKDNRKKLEIYNSILEFKFKNNTDLRATECDSVLHFAETNKLDTCHILRKIYTNVLSYYNSISDPVQYNKFAFKFLLYLEKKSDFEKIISIKIGIADNYTRLHLFDESMKVLKDAENDIKDKNIEPEKQKILLKSILNSYALLYYEQKMFDKALEYGKKSLNIAKETNDYNEISNALNIIGICYNDMGKHSEALKVLFELLALDKKMQSDISIDYYNIANTYTLMRDVQNATRYVDSAIYYYPKSDIKFIEILPECYYLLMEINIIKGNTEKAFEYRNKFFEIKDSINNAQFKEELAKQSTLYKVELKEQEKQKLIAEKKQQQAIIIGSVITIFLSILLIAFVFRSYKIKQKSNIELERKNHIIELQKKLVEEQNKNITDSIHYASRIQRALLATDEYLNQHFKQLLSDYFILYMPKDIVSGDFYWATQKDNYFYFVIGDSTGHGVPGAFMSLLNINFLNEAIVEKNILNTGEIFDYVKKQLTIYLHGEKDGMDATIVRFDLNNRNNIQYSAANHQPVLINHQKELVKCNYTKSPIGVDDVHDSSFETVELSLSKGDKLYLFTDGYADQFGGEKDKKMQKSNFYRILQQYSSLPPSEQKDFLKKIFIEWKGNKEQTDDVCVAGLFF